MLWFLPALDCSPQLHDPLQDAPILWEAPTPRAVTGGTKVPQGTALGEVHLTDNFAVTWLEGDASAAQAEAVGAALEAAWAVLVDQRGWAAPRSSETWLLWVVADPFLGADGQTDVVYSDTYPDGYPVLSLDPTLTEQRLAAAAAHQLMHALQLRLRTEEERQGASGWYFEATAVWAEAEVDPLNTHHVPLARGYLDYSWLAYDSTLSGHDGGLFLLNRWFEQWRPGMVQEIWMASVGADLDWPSLFRAQSGLDDGSLWGGFNGWLAIDGHGAEYGSPMVSDEAHTGTASYLSYLATEFFVHDGDALARLEVIPLIDGQQVVLAHGEQVGSEVVVEPDGIVSVTGLSEGGANFQFLVSDAADPDGPLDSGLVVTGGPRQSSRVTTGSCSHTGGPGLALGAGWFVLLLMRRRQ